MLENALQFVGVWFVASIPLGVAVGKMLARASKETTPMERQGDVDMALQYLGLSSSSPSMD